MTSLLRPRKRSSPVASLSAISPVASHSSRAGAAAPPVQVALGDHGAAHEHFAVGAELHFAAGERLADGAAGHVERMIERDERGGFGHAVALHEHEAERVPELLERPGSAPPPEIERPELEAELAMHAAEAPPALPGLDAL